MNKFKAIFQITLIILTSFTVYLLSAEPVSAVGCCEQVGDEYCQAPTSNNPCSTSVFTPNVLSCSDTTFCKLGTCYLDNECSSNVPKATCEGEGGQWFDRPLSQVQECSQGCCVLGTNCVLSTEAQCTDMGSDNFKSNINNKNTCTYECVKADKGCCVRDGSFTYTTREQCDNIQGDFNNNRYCSQLDDSDCEKHSYKACGLVDEDNLYWYDSCGNQEEMAQECEEFRELCATDINDQNGNGDEEEYVCRDITCSDIWQNPFMDDMRSERLHGESWCSYQSATGPGKDLPGSIHYRHECVLGEEIAYPCDDYREQVCMYTDVTDPETGTVMGTSYCKDNRYDNCYFYNKEECENPDLGDCGWIADRCIPLNPPGYSDDDVGECMAAEVVTQVAWEKEPGEDWEIVENEEALSSGFLINTNSLCKAMGDCGADYNVACDFSYKGFRRNCGKTHGEKCLRYIYEGLTGNCDDFKYSGVGGYIEYFEKPEWMDQLINDADFTFALGTLGVTLTTLYGYGIIQSLAWWTAANAPAVVFVENFVGALIPNFGPGFIEGMSTAFGPTGLGAMSTFGVVLSAIAIAVTIYIVVNIILEILTEHDITTVSTSCQKWRPPTGSENCEMCHTSISEGGLLPDKNGEIIEGYECNEYTCNSLGTGCQYIRDSSQGPVCIPASEEDQIPPLIKPDNGALDVECYSGTCGIKSNGVQGYEILGTIKEYTKVSFGIATVNEYGDPLLSRCYYEEGDEFDVQNPVYSNSFSNGRSGYKHNITLYNLEDGKTHRYHVKCENAISGMESIVDYVIKFTINEAPDLTPPIIEKFDPKNNGYVASFNEEVNVGLYVNELVDERNADAGCKWSNENIIYEQMTNRFVCATPSSTLEMQKCEGVLPGIQDGANIFYVSCKDNSGNVNSPVQYTITKTQPLNLDSVNVLSDRCRTDSEGKLNCFTNEITLEAKTSGGAETGNAVCSYSSICDTEGCMQDEFFNSHSALHSQPDLIVNEGINTYYVRCVDVAGNIATGSISVYGSIDNTAPVLEKVLYDSSFNKLKIIIKDLNEVTCKYSDSDFSFDSEGTEMSKVDNEFYADWGLSNYYIQCRDSFGNDMPLHVVHV